MVRVLVIVLLLTACTRTEYESENVKFSSWRLWTTTAATIKMDNVEATYSSDPNTAAMMNINQMLLDAYIKSRTP